MSSSHHGHINQERISRLQSIIPKGTWDTHMHCVDPTKFPLSKDAKYTPSPHTMQQARDFLSRLGIEKMVIVQPSVYDNDNACTLDGLKQLGPQNGRAVIQFDPDETGQEQLKEWHDLGVRGVRLNFKSVGAKVEGEGLARQLRKYAEAVKSFGWVLELYIALEDIPLLEPIVPELGDDVKICIDHIGHPTDASLSTAQSVAVLPGLQNLTNLLTKHDNIWVKVSGTYRLSRDAKNPLVQSLGRTILRTRPDRCVFATDWPHTRFEDVDVGEYLEEILEWCQAEGVELRKVLVDNAEVLFDARG